MSNTTIKEYNNITKYGYIKDGKVFLKGYFDFEDREIGIVKESDEKSLEYFVKRFDIIKEKPNAVKEAINKTENKGSYLMKLIHFRDYLSKYNGLGDFESLYNFIDDLEKEITGYIEKNRAKNTDIKTILVAEIEVLKHNTNWIDTDNKIRDLKDKWIKTGNAYIHVDHSLKTRFDDAYNFFFEAKKAYHKNQIRLWTIKIINYKELIDKLRHINRRGAGAIDLDKVKDIQKEWRNIGKVPKHKFAKVSFEFRTELQNFYNMLKFTEEIFNLPPIDAKKELLKITEQILEKDTPYNINAVKQIQGSWKKLGRLSHLEDRELNLKFRIICNEVFESYFLERMAKYLDPNFFRLKPDERNKIKIELIKESIQKDESDLQVFNDKNIAELAFIEQYPRSNYHLAQQKNNFVNKIKIKQKILKKLKRE